MAMGDLQSRTVIGFHRFTFENYSLCRHARKKQHFSSGSFFVGGYQWAVTVYPYETFDDDKITDETTPQDEYVGFRVALMSASADGVHCFLKITLLDQSGEGKHKTASLFDSDEGPFLAKTNQQLGFPNFIRRRLLDDSCYVKYDCLKIECTLGVVLPSETDAEIAQSSDVSLCDDPGLDFLDMLETGEGFDVVFYVKGEKFRAHKVILSARSSFFESMFNTNQLEEITLKGIEPHVFKVLLHFIYSDNLPEDEKSLADGYAFGPSVSATFAAQLLAAADACKMVRLKSICESHLWRSISLKRFAEILLLADTYNASSLKHLCFEYAANANFHAALVELDSITYLRKNGPSTLIDELDGLLSQKGKNIKLSAICCSLSKRLLKAQATETLSLPGNPRKRAICP